MAYYNYKHVRDSIPDSFLEPWEKRFKEETGREYSGTADYDGELWILASDYIDHLHAKVKDLESRRELAIEALRDDDDPTEALALLEGRKGTGG